MFKLILVGISLRLGLSSPGTTFDPISLQIQLVAFIWGSNSQLRLLGSAAWDQVEVVGACASKLLIFAGRFGPHREGPAENHRE